MQSEKWLIDLRGRFKDYREDIDEEIESKLFDLIHSTSSTDSKSRLSQVISWSFLITLILLPLRENSRAVVSKTRMGLEQITQTCAPAAPAFVTSSAESISKNNRTYKEPTPFFTTNNQPSEGGRGDSFTREAKMSQLLDTQKIATATTLSSSTETDLSPFTVSQTSKDTVDSKKETLSRAPQTKIDSIKNTNRPSKRKEISFYFSAAPALNYFFIDPDHNDNNLITGVSNMSILDKNRLAYSLEAGLQLNISKHVTAYTGMSFLTQKSRISYHYYNAADLQISPGGTAGEYSVEPVKGDHQFDYSMINLGIQGGLLYTLQGDRLKHKVGLGFSYQLGGRDAQGGSYANKGSSYLFGRLMYRFECQLTNKMVGYVQPQYDLSLWANERLNEPMKINAYRVGFGLGVIYSFQTPSNPSGKR